MKTEKDIHIKEPPAGFNWLERDILYLNKLIKSQRSPKNLQKKLSSENWYFWNKKNPGKNYYFKIYTIQKQALQYTHMNWLS